MSEQGILACIAVRIPIKFNPVQLFQQDANVERGLVVNHMHLLLSPFPGSSSHDGSDPKYDGAVQRPIVRAVRQFLEALFGRERAEECAASLPRAYHTAEFATTPLHTAFQEALIYFNHFNKVRSYEVVNQAYLLLAISCGAAIICPDEQVGINIVIPVLIGTSLVKENVTAIFVQANYSRHYGAKIQYPVFMNMNPYTCGLFDRDVKEPPPALRMVFALASPDAAVATPIGPARQSPRSSNRTAAFTAYDIWCAGASHKTFAVIQEDEDAAIASLLKLMRNADDRSARLESQCAGGAHHATDGAPGVDETGPQGAVCGCSGHCVSAIGIKFMT
ncbi:hypothetical protein BV20DRAFT_984042 [Pilatotrama ljubarskyi]|nr:hypothetical protein BV20DRAFT_984042 [Pilatotrama ljubarskyi]